MIICERENCVGCAMCLDLCPKNAITMKEDERGFLYPVIDEKLCVNCGLCKTKCPANNQVKNSARKQNVYAMWNKNKKIRKVSTSGGIFSLLAKKVLATGGVVVGVKWSKDFEPEHYATEKEEELIVFYGSKYVQSNAKGIYKKVKEFLSQDRVVLFSGTPCQNHALENYLGKEENNLIRVDLCCHGVPSYKLFNSYLKELEGGKRQVKSVNLRYKENFKWDFCNVRVDFDDNSTYSVPTVDDPYFTLFNIGYSLRDCCHSCKYTNTNRPADITLMDFWDFIPKNFKMGDYNKGISCVFTNTEKGEKLIGEILKDCVVEQRTMREALASNKSLSQPFVIEKEKTENFWEDVKSNMSLTKLCDKYVPVRFKIPKRIKYYRLKRRYSWLAKKILRRK